MAKGAAREQRDCFGGEFYSDAFADEVKNDRRKRANLLNQLIVAIAAFDFSVLFPGPSRSARETPRDMGTPTPSRGELTSWPSEIQEPILASCTYSPSSCNKVRADSGTGTLPLRIS